LTNGRSGDGSGGPAQADQQSPRPWKVEHLRGRAGRLFAREVTAARTIAIMEVTKAALVLGSTQPPVAYAPASIELVRRNTGGGAVHVVPRQLVWIDVTIPRDDALWEDDVGRAFHWLGAAWADALHELGVEARPHLGGIRDTRWSRMACFAGLGPGELTVDGRKVVGIAQRRTRDAALFQCAALLAWDPRTLVDLLVHHAQERARAVADLQDVAAPLPAAADALVDAFVAAVAAR
jgi:lipoate-protein ligase A